MIELITKFDKEVFHFLNSDIKNNVLDSIFPAIATLGEGGAIILLIILLFIFGRKNGKRTSILVFAAYILSRLSVLILKRLTHRPRPSFVYDHVNLIGKPLFSSFPSGHTTLATAVFVVLCFKYKKLSPLFIFLAFMVGVARIYAGQHYPTDVLAGFILGGAIAFIIVHLEKVMQNNKVKSAA